MSYKTMKTKLLTVFNKYDFKDLILNDNFNTQNTLIDTLDNGSKIYITFPGYKSKIKGNFITYDYRVNIRNTIIDTALSHVNIIIDLYNKAIQLGQNAYILRNLLYDLAANGDNYTRNNYLLLDQSIFNTPGRNLLNYSNNIHTNLNKQYNKQGNSWNYSLDELIHSILWIVLQEDINYPMPRFQGRRMPFYRYLETLYCAQNPNDEIHTLGNVIERALSHTRPNLWINCINYDNIENLV